MADTGGNIKGVAGWLVKANLMQSGVARRCQTPLQLADELHNGVVLAQIARKLDPGNVGPDRVMGRPSIDYHRRLNVSTFVDAYRRVFNMKVRFTVDDVELRQNTEQVVSAIHKVAKRIESPDLIAFTMPKSRIFRGANAVDREIYEMYPTSDSIKSSESVESYYNEITQNDETHFGEYEHVISVYASGDFCGTYEDGHLWSKYDCAVEEFLGKNRAFCKALNLYQEIGKFSTDNDLRKWFLNEDFSNTIGKLRAFHQKLQEELDEEGREGAFYDVIIKNKTHFLQYCHVLVQTENLKTAIMRKDSSDMKKELSIVKKQVGKDLTRLTNFDSLLSLPFQHLLRQSILLEAILKEGKREEYDFGDDVLNGIKAAVDAMMDVNDFVNAHFGDAMYIDDIEDTFQRTSIPDGWRGFDYKLVGGYSKFSQKVQLRMLNADKFFWCQIFAFEELVLIFEIDDRGVRGEWLILKQMLKVCDIVATGVTEMKVLQVDGGDGHAKVKQSKSFVIKGALEKLQELEKKFKDLTRPRISKCCVRLGEYIRPKEGPRSWNIIEEKCNRCQRLLRGRINLGLRCPGCGNFYHKKCFEDIEEEEITIQERRPSKDHRLEEMLFRLGTKEDEGRMLSSEAPDGSFLFRPSEKAPSCLTLSVKKGQSLKKYKILTEVKEGPGTTYMWKNQTVQGEDCAEERFPTLTNLVQRKRRAFHLKRDFLDGQNLVGEETREQRITNACVLLGTIEDEERMKKAFRETKNTLLNAGTFLLRPSDGGGGYTLCIMNKNKGGKWVARKHHIQKGVNGDVSYSFVKGKGKKPDKEETYPSLDAFIRCKWHYFQLERNFLGDKSFDDMFGGGAAVCEWSNGNGEAEKAKQEVLSLQESTSSSTESSPLPPRSPIINFKRVDERQALEVQLYNLKFYVGYMEGYESHVALSNEPPGTYLLRRKSKDDPDFRITFVTEEEEGHKEYTHLRIKEMENGGIACKQNGKQFEAESLEDLIAQMDGPRYPYSPKK